MKKLLTLTFVISALLLGAMSVSAQSYKYKKTKAVKGVKYNNNGYYNRNNRHYNRNNGYYNRRVAYTFYKTKIKWKYGRKYKHTYKVTVLRNGRKIVKLVNVKPVRRHYRVHTYYTSKIVHRGWKTYRLTYKVKHFRNGRIKKKLVKKQRIYRKYYW
ncbi:MAG: hypothetical protein HKN25_12840 [Pyrinomonadaceae bacterium]|nr:hypothetical protein [Pyrinomonadaceae bacterium]